MKEAANTAHDKVWTKQWNKGQASAYLQCYCLNMETVKEIFECAQNVAVLEDAIQKNDSIINQIIRLRDSIGEKYIPGPVEGSHMITEMAYTPFLNETIIDNKPTLETKSTWEVKNAYMAGPFINYIIEDKQNEA